MMNKQSDNPEALFRAARQTEPDLSDQAFADAVMQQISKTSANQAMTARQKNIILWLAATLGVLIAGSVFPINEIFSLITNGVTVVYGFLVVSSAFLTTEFTGFFSMLVSGVTLPVISFIALMISTMAYSAYQVVEADGI
ncbi:MAG: hypothetical protein JXA04_08995 [Gammaproteobacteria bacterium]|nr:hypothetical protein [Gammaproteobacteria bacterium]